MITIDRPTNELTMSDSLRSEMGAFRIKALIIPSSIPIFVVASFNIRLI